MAALIDEPVNAIRGDLVRHHYLHSTIEFAAAVDRRERNSEWAHRSLVGSLQHVPV